MPAIRTRSANTSYAVKQKIAQILYEEVTFIVKWNTLCPGNGTFPDQPTPEEAADMKLLKKQCYGEAALRYKQMGVFSSGYKKEILKDTLLQNIRICDADIDSWNQYKHLRVDTSDRTSRAEVQRAVFKALLVGFQKAKLSDGRLAAFDF